jgi:(p)ppGpp synthase/HD superfamily hydrolase
MNNFESFQEAILLATEAHYDQYDKAGMPYILHPLRVASVMNTEEEKIVAVLHDVVEDTDVASAEIHHKYGSLIGNAVDAITKKEKVNGRFESYRDIALKVKLADMTDNSLPERLASLSVEKQVRLAAKYARGRHYLLTGEWYESKELDTVIKAGYKK